MIKNEIKIYLTSKMLYTRIPCPSFIDHSEEYLNKATRYFPLVGIIVGSLSFFSFWLTNLIFNEQISVLVSIATGIIVTGAFHEDGLADTFDGFGGGWTKEKILEMLIEIEGDLDDAFYSLPEYNANVDSQGYIDGARCDLYYLKDEIEKAILDDKSDSQ